MGNSSRSRLIVGLACLTVLVTLLVLGRNTFHDRIELGSGLTDATSYAERAKQLAVGDTRLTLGTAFRMPGYPAFLALFYGVGLGPAAARLLQVLLASCYAGLAFVVVRRIGNTLHGVLAALIVMAFVPFYYWTTWLFAEPLSIFWTFVLLWLLTLPFSESLRGAAVVGLVLTLLCYLKPNQLLLTPLVALWYLLRRGFSRAAWRAGLRRAGVAVAIVVALVAPWSLAASRGKQHFVPLSTAQGIDLWIGVGGYGTEAKESLFGRAVEWSGLYDEEEKRSVERAAFAEPDFSGRSRYFQDAARARAIAHPGKVLVIGLSKSLHLLGLSLRHTIDFVYLAFTAAAAASAFVLHRKPVLKPWVWAWLLLMLTACAQAFAFLPNYRFRVVLCDPLSALLIALALGDVLERRAPRLARLLAPQAEA